MRDPLESAFLTLLMFGVDVVYGEARPEMAPKRSLCRLLSGAMPGFCGVTSGVAAGSESSFTVCPTGGEEEITGDDFQRAVLVSGGRVPAQDARAWRGRAAWGRPAPGAHDQRQEHGSDAARVCAQSRLGPQSHCLLPQKA